VRNHLQLKRWDSCWQPEVNPLALDHEGLDALDYAAERCHLEVISLLVKLVPTLLHQPAADKTAPALHWAAAAGNTDAVKLLVRHYTRAQALCVASSVVAKGAPIFQARFQSGW
jgi:ankyrin repeat protein